MRVHTILVLQNKSLRRVQIVHIIRHLWVFIPKSATKKKMREGAQRDELERAPREKRIGASLCQSHNKICSSDPLFFSAKKPHLPNPRTAVLFR